MRLHNVLVWVYLLLMFPANIIGLWWAVGSPLVMDPNSVCRKSRRLVGKQRKLCRKEPEIVENVAKGAQLALLECHFQFRQRRWNCTARKRSISRIWKTDTREAAFLYAVTAAGVVHAVTRACSLGSLLTCSCHSHARDVSTDGEWEWGGCGDDVDFGYRKSKEFMDVRRRKRRRRGDLTTMIHLHNNEAGRRAVRNDMRQECKCHGLSGSCTLKTCWLKMPPFRTVGHRLKDSFDGASKVISSNDGTGLLPEGPGIKPPSRDDLVYSEQSPNFCKRKRRVGSLGTRGRECDPGSLGVGGCDLLCCGRGYSREEVTVRENCKCRFMWCCQVLCDTCVSVKTVHRCL